jgi:hypothetical protein
MGRRLLWTNGVFFLVVLLHLLFRIHGYQQNARSCQNHCQELSASLTLRLPGPAPVPFTTATYGRRRNPDTSLSTLWRDTGYTRLAPHPVQVGAQGAAPYWLDGTTVRCIVHAENSGSRKTP